MAVTSDNTNLQKYYDYLKSAKADVPDNFESFQKTLSDEGNAHKYYDYLKANKFDTPDTYESFSHTLGLKKKDATDYGLPTSEAFSKVLSKVSGTIPEDQIGRNPHKDNNAKTLGLDLPEGMAPKGEPSLKDIENKQYKGEDMPVSTTGINIPQEDKIPVTHPQPEESYIGAVSKGVYKGVANLVRDIGYLAVDYPKELKVESLELGVKAQAAITGDTTLKKYSRAVAESIDNGLYGGNTASLMKEGYERTADFLDKTLAEKTGETPHDEFGKSLEATGEFLPDLFSMSLFPEAKAPLLVKYGLENMLKFPAYLGLKSYAEGMKEGKPVKEIVGQSGAQVEQGLLFNSLGILSGEAGQLAKDMGAGVWTTHGVKLLANSLGFGGLEKAQGGSFAQGMMQGFTFGMLDTPEAVKDVLTKRAMLSYMTATDNNIRLVNSMNIDPVKAREESMKLFMDIQNEKDPDKKSQLIAQKNVVDNAININFVTQSVLRNPDAFLKSINDSPVLSAREKKIWTDKFRTTIKENDPRRKEAAPVVENIDRMQNELNDAKNDESLNPTEKEAKVAGLENKINEEKKNAEKIFSKSVDDYNELKPENKERDLNKIAEDAEKEAQKAKEAKEAEEKAKAEKEKAETPPKEEWEDWDKKTFQENLIKASTGKNKRLSDQVANAAEAHPEWGKFKADVSKIEPKTTKEPKAKTEIPKTEQSPEEIAKKNNIEYVGKQEGNEPDGSDALDMYNVKVDGKDASFAVKAGSDENAVIEARDKMVDSFKTKPQEKEKPKEEVSGAAEKPSARLWDKGDKDTPESVKIRFGIADQEFTSEDIDNIPDTPLWNQNGRNVIGVDDSYMKTHFYSNWTEGGNSAVYPEWNPHGDIHVANNVDDEYKKFVAAHEIWEEYKVEKKGLLYSSAQGSAHEQSNKMEIPLRRFYDEQLKPNGGDVLSIDVTDEGFHFTYKETADGPEKEATMFPDGTMRDGKHGNSLGEEEPPKTEEKPKTEKDETEIPKPTDTEGKKPEDNIPAGTPKGEGGAETEGAEKPPKKPKYTKEQQKKVAVIYEYYNNQIKGRQEELDKIPDQKKKAKLEADSRNQIFGDPNAKPSDLIKPGEQGFKVTPETIDAVGKKFDERAAQLTKEIADLTKERDSKIGEVKKQQNLFPEEKPAEKPIADQGVEFNGKYYTDIDDVQQDFIDKKLTPDEHKQLLEKVRNWEDDLRRKADTNARNVSKKFNSNADESDKNLKDEDDKLQMRILPPDVISKGNTVLWKHLFAPLRDKVSDAIANRLQAGLESQNNAIRNLAKFAEMAYRGLARTQKDTFGTDESGKKVQVGELEMRGTSGIFARNESQWLMNNLRDIVGGSEESLENVFDVLDPELSTKPKKYGDLSNSEKNLYWAVRDWNTWVHETTFANGFIDAKTYMKFKDPNTGEVQYLGREYDTHLQEDEDRLTAEMRALTQTGDNGIITGIYKARQEVNEAMQEHAIKDPAYLTALRVRQTIQNDARIKYMNSIVDNHPNFVRTLKPGEDVPKGFDLLGNFRKWGPFRNKAVLHSIVEDFTGFHFANTAANTWYDAFKVYNRQKFNQFYRAWRTSLNPFVQTGNYTGSHFFGAINGFNPLEILVEKENWKKEAKNRTALYKAVEKSGVLLESGVTGEKIPDFAKKTSMYQTLTGDQTLIDKARTLFNRGQKLAGQNYIDVENNVKGAAYLICRKQGLTHDQAVRRVYDSFRNYAHIGKLWDVASKTPLIGPTFVKFQADMQRIMLNGITMNPLTTIGNLALISAIGATFSYMSGETPEQKKEREHRKGTPQISLPFGLSIPLSFKVGKSEVNAARYLSPMYNYVGEDNSATLSDLSKFLPFQFQKKDKSKLFPTAVFGDATWGFVGSAVLADRDFRNQSISNPTSNKWRDPNPSTWSRIINVLHYAARSQVPFFRSGEDIYDAMTGKLDYYGRKRTIIQSLLNNVIKVQQFNDPELKAHMERQLEYTVGEYADLAKSMGDAEGDYNRTVQRAIENGATGDALTRIEKAADRVRASEINHSLKEMIPVNQEIDSLTMMYSKWNPDDPFIKENGTKMREGMTRRFNVLNGVEFQKKYPEEYMLLKNNQVLKAPKVPDYYLQKPLTAEDKERYANIYWTNYLNMLKGFVPGGLTKEAFEKAKKQTWQRGMTLTDEEPKETNLLKEMARQAEEQATNIASATFRNKKAESENP
jgi:hypothetical protein